MSFHADEESRLKGHSSLEAGNNGLFLLTKPTRTLLCQISDGMGWEHVSVSLYKSGTTVPNWEEMCFVKDTFWDEEDCVVQFHPPKSKYVDNFRVLH